MCVLECRVTPNAPANQLLELKEEEGIFLRLKIKSPPVDGKANQCLIQYLSKILGLKKRDLELFSGDRSRMKLIRAHGTSREMILEKLRENLSKK